MDFNELYTSVKESLSAFKEHSVYHTHMFQYQAVGSATGVALAIFADFFFPGLGKLVGMAITPISFFTARKMALKNWNEVVKEEKNKGNYIFAVQEAKRLYESKCKEIERSRISPEKKAFEREKAYDKYSTVVDELTEKFYQNQSLLLNAPLPTQSPVQKLIENSDINENKMSIVKSRASKPRAN